MSPVRLVIQFKIWINSVNLESLTWDATYCKQLRQTSGPTLSFRWKKRNSEVFDRFKCLSVLLQSHLCHVTDVQSKFKSCSLISHHQLLQLPHLVQSPVGRGFLHNVVAGSGVGLQQGGLHGLLPVDHEPPGRHGPQASLESVLSCWPASIEVYTLKSTHWSQLKFSTAVCKY